MRRWATAVWLGALAGACGGSAEQPNPTARIDTVEIEADVALIPEPGRGAATHLEYFAGGEWNVVFTCDTELSGYVCDYDLVASVEAPLALEAVRARDFEPDDTWYRLDRGAIHVLAFTAFDSDAITLRTEPGTALRIDVLLDGVPVQSAVAWAARGSVRTRAPTLPLELLPDRP